MTLNDVCKKVLKLCTNCDILIIYRILCKKLEGKDCRKEVQMLRERYRKSLSLILSAALTMGIMVNPVLAAEVQPESGYTEEFLTTEVSTDNQSPNGQLNEDTEEDDEEDTVSGDTVSGDVVSGDEAISENEVASENAREAGSKPVEFNFPSKYTYKVDTTVWSGLSSYSGKSFSSSVSASEKDSHEWAYAVAAASTEKTGADEIANALYGESNDPLGLFDDDTTSGSEEKYGNSAIATFLLANSTKTNGVKGMLKDAAWVPITDVNAIKGLVYKYGSAVIDVYRDQTYSNNAYNSASNNHIFTTVSEDYAAPNHELLIIGWDNNADRNEFVNPVTGNVPKGNGAFEVVDGLGEHYWISYEDATFTASSYSNERRAVAFKFSDNMPYNNTYAYDGTAQVATKEVSSVANVFVADANKNKYEAIKEVGFAVADPGQYRVYIYSYPYKVSSNGTPFIADNLISVVDADVNYAGYTTVSVDTPVLLVDGKNFAVEVRRADESKFNAFVTTSSNSVDDWIEFNDTNTDKYSKKRNSGLSFYKNEVTGSAYVSKATPRIKVFTDNVNTLSKVSANGTEVTLPYYFYKYTGKNISPKVIVEANGYRYNSDSGLFTRVLVGCKDVGSAHMMVSSNKVFNGYQGVSFEITDKSGAKISRAKVYGVDNRKLDSNKDYDQTDVLVMCKLANNGTMVPLREGVDYVFNKTVTGTNADKKRLKTEIKGIGTFKGTKKNTFKVYSSKKPIADDKTMDISLVYQNHELDNFEEVNYTGTKIKPTVTVKDTETGAVLKEGTDYKVKYSSNKNPGVAKVTIVTKGEAKNTYVGKTVKYFVIKQRNIAGAKVTDEYSSYAYTGSAISPSLNVVVNGKNVGSGNFAVYTINNVSQRSKSDSTVKNRPTAYVFGKKRYAGYAGVIYYTISTTTTKK